MALNAQRAAEEAAGLVRWLRPEFQNPDLQRQQQQPLTLIDDEVEEGPPAGKPGKKKPAAKTGTVGGEKPAQRQWPKARTAQAKAVLAALRDFGRPATAAELAQCFARAQAETVDELLQAIVTLGLARRTRGGKYAC